MAQFDDPKLKERKRLRNKKALILGLGAAFSVLIFFIFQLSGGFDALRRWMRGPEQTENPVQIITEATDKANEERIKELERRLQMADTNTNQMQNDFEARLKQLTGNNDNSKQIEALTVAIGSLKDSQLEMQRLADQREDEFLKKLLELQKIDRTVITPEIIPKSYYPDEPRQGNAGATILFTSVEDYAERLEKERLEREALANAAPPFEYVDGLVQGDMVKGTLKTRLITSAALTKFIAVIEMVEPVVIGKVTLPLGTKFLGKANADFPGRRIYVDIYAMRVGDTMFNMNGILLDHRGNPGLVSKYIDPLMTAAWSSIVPTFLASAAYIAQDWSTRTTTNMYTGDTTTYDTPDKTVKNAALQGVGNTLVNFSNILMSAARNKQPVIIVNSGIKVQIQFLETIPENLLLQAIGATKTK